MNKEKLKDNKKENKEIKEHEQWLEEIRNSRIEFKKPAGIRILDSNWKYIYCEQTETQNINKEQEMKDYIDWKINRICFKKT